MPPGNLIPRIPITILTGFLGSGKTTLLTRFLHLPEMTRTAVIINEFGDVGLDHLLVTHADEKTVLLSSGCICCTIRSDLAETLRDLHRRRMVGEIPDFDRVVVETTGLAEPAPILQTLVTDPVILGYFKVAGVVTTVDGLNGLAQVTRQVETVRQIAVADRLVVTKQDLANPASVVALFRRLSAMNPTAEIVDRVEDWRVLDFADSRYSLDIDTLNAERWLGSTPAVPSSWSGQDNGCDSGCAHGDHPSPHDEIGSCTMIVAEPLPWAALVGFLEALTELRGLDILRVKGIVNVDESDLPVVIQGVQKLFHPPTQLPAWPGPDRSSRIVFIGRGLDLAALEELLSVCLAAMSPRPAAC